MSNKSYGLDKERKLKKLLYDEGAMFVSRSRGSFGAFDIEAYFPEYCMLISCKATKQRYYSFKQEIEAIKSIKIPTYCKKQLRIWLSPHPKRAEKGWKIIDF